MKFINHIFTTYPGEQLSNTKLLPNYLKAIELLPLASEDQQKLLESVQYFMMGQRDRWAVPNALDLSHFKDRAVAYERGVEQALGELSEQIQTTLSQTPVQFDAIITTTSTGNLMPGISYRMAAKLADFLHPNSLLLDLGNVGCTGSLKAINLARNLNQQFHNILVIAIELPTTLLNLKAKTVDIWQGNCTFGDGGTAIWISDRPEQGSMALRLEQIHYVQWSATDLNLIHWGYHDYYTFQLANETTFNQRVQFLVYQTLLATAQSWRENPHWAVHPAGIALLLRLSRKLGLPREALKLSTQHFEQFSNMSSVSIIQILQQAATIVPTGSQINLLTMGAGFNVIYGQVKKEH